MHFKGLFIPGKEYAKSENLTLYEYEENKTEIVLGVNKIVQYGLRVIYQTQNKTESGKLSPPFGLDSQELQDTIRKIRENPYEHLLKKLDSSEKVSKRRYQESECGQLKAGDIIVFDNGQVVFYVRKRTTIILNCNKEKVELDIEDIFFKLEDYFYKLKDFDELIEFQPIFTVYRYDIPVLPFSQIIKHLVDYPYTRIEAYRIFYEKTLENIIHIDQKATSRNLKKEKMYCAMVTDKDGLLTLYIGFRCLKQFYYFKDKQFIEYKTFLGRLQTIKELMDTGVYQYVFK